MNLGQLNISVEDRFIILHLNVESNVLPSNDILDNLAYVLASLGPKYQVICDFRNVKYITNDLIEFIEQFECCNAQVLLDEKDLSFFRKKVNKRISLLPIYKYETKFEEYEINLCAFADEFKSSYNTGVGHVYHKLSQEFSERATNKEFLFYANKDRLHGKNFYESYDNFMGCYKIARGMPMGAEIILSRRYLIDTVTKIGRKSLLSQYCIFPSRDGNFHIKTFQSNSINESEAKNQIIQCKPYVPSDITNKLFQKTLLEFQLLISDKSIKESKIQKFLENNPIFLQSLGYKSIRPQVILERDDGSSLRPDFLLEPIGDEWWDILDIKLPFKQVIIDKKIDRYKFSEAVNELQAQLREYAAYFENEKYAKRIEDKYGIKCYKPKMIGIIGNEFNGDDERQMRRLITSYSDLKIVPFDKLYKICKERLLI